MKKTMAIMLLWCLGIGAAIADEVPQVANVLARQTFSLNGQWNYIIDVQEEGYYDYRMNPTQWGFFRNAKPQKPEDLIEYDFDKAPTMQIPGDWNTQDVRLFFYEGTVWFKRTFDYHPTNNRRTLLYFGAINYDAHVYVNGRKAGHHVGGFTPFNFDVTELLKDGENTVIVKVDNKRHAEDVPTQIFDWWNYGGITRDVLLVSVAPTYVENYTLSLDKESTNKKAARQISFQAKLNKAEAGQIISLNIPELKVKQQIATAADGTATVTLKAKNLKLWSPEQPKRFHRIPHHRDSRQANPAERKTYLPKGHQHPRRETIRRWTRQQHRRCPHAPFVGKRTGLQLRTPGSLSSQRICCARG